MFVSVTVNIPSDKTFSYAVPEALQKEITIGKRVLIPFGKRILTGHIIEVSQFASCENIKEIINILDREPLFNESDLKFYRWLSRYYIYPLGKALAEILPGGIPKKEKIVGLNPPNTAPNKKLTKKQTQLLDFLGQHGPQPLTALRGKFRNILPAIKILEEHGAVFINEEEVLRYHGQKPDIGAGERPITPNEDQEFALQEIVKSLESGRFSPYLLHGVTGSGKTEVYLNAIEQTIRMKGGVIFLVPEIALTPLLISRFNRRFSDYEMAVLHSGISMAARYDQWRRIQRGEIKVVIGARSAVFAPVRNLKLVIVDEEHDTSYKQDDRMRYNARDLAIMKAKINSATVVAGSATPAIQTYFNTMKKKYKCLILPRRVEDRPLPGVEIIDMKPETGEYSRGAVPILSRALQEAIADTLKKGGQAILFLNRRGFHTFMFCLDCGHAFKCRNCAVSMTYHAEEGSLKCHYCDFVVKLPTTCPGCRGNRIHSYGVGTERLAEEVKRLFPEARTERMDSDTTARKGASENILKAFDRRDIDILVGTQMVAKGHDFPGVTLVGVISADMSLNIPDFRAAERTFQLLTQVSGRGGRGASPGRVIIQTVNPEHYAITRASNHDYLSFYEEELSLRSALAWPPFSRMINLHLSSSKKEKDTEGLEKLKGLIKALLSDAKLKGEVEVIGPAESPIAKIKGKHRWQLLLKGKDAAAVNALAKGILSGARATGLDIRIDVDPVNFM